jgi:hypothetical protein
VKIGILTFHRSVNDGAVLQAYCLQQILQAQFPQASVELIDYRPWTLERIEYRKLFRRRFPFINRYKWAQHRSLQEFLHQHCTLSLASCTTNTLQKVQNFILNQEYDGIVVGSDVVWQIRDQGLIPPVPNIFWLTGLQGMKKLAFAVSADKSEKLSWQLKHNQEQLLASLEDFHWISVRDEATRQMLLQLGLAETQVSYMPDPTILWDFSSIVNTPQEFEQFPGKLAGVAVGSSFIRKKLTQIMLAKGYHVINLLGARVKGQISLPLHYSLNQRLGIYSLLDLMVTDRFHGSIFTLKLGHAPLIFLEVAEKYPDCYSKGRDLLRRIGGEAMVWRTESRDIGDNLDYYLARWHELFPDIKSGLGAIRQSSFKDLEQISKILD